ncbi:tRNA lysidine(34) synthetase TilS [Aurantibacillus circumpalustris]|uniref:tRNA lysidine(34) synthetase TilS n=1 Tax=Aurantibacillus circumpalustris TaxID=3036359 RepID=UPI00295B09B1|nr:tRNA lysidine(34) synthetase TilS [Aurantibacillus circumpalustris]
MLKEFESNILKTDLFNKKHNLLVAVSGGIDSIVLTHLLKNSGFKFSIAHCNFQLRGKESLADEKFCKDLAKKIKIPFYTKAFDTEAYCTKHKTNVQLAARKLRYDWFHELIIEKQFDYVLTAHHANDVIETVFINLLRGTGIKGIKGISEKKGQIIRPLLNFTREQIDAFAKKHTIDFRLDKSNLEDKYERNFIRLNIIPLFKKINPKLEETFIRNTANFRQEAGIVHDYLEEKTTELITQTHDAVFINKKKLKHETYSRSVLHNLISGYGFNDTQQKNILSNLGKDAQSGKIFKSPTHQLIIDRNDLVIKSLSEETFNDKLIASYDELIKQKLFSCKKLAAFKLPKPNELLLDESKLQFPLSIRLKRTGDKFKPFGMKGFKLLSDFLKDEKLSIPKKESCKVLVNGNGDIIWVIGHRSDERYRVNSNKKNILKLKLIE